MRHGRLAPALAGALLLLLAASAGAATRGTLQQLGGTAGCVLFANDSSEGCALRPPFRTGAGGIAVSPDGAHVYHASGNVLFHFDRAQDGTLTTPGQPPACYSADSALGCTVVSTLVGTAGDLVMSGDGKHLYVSSSGPRATWS